MSTVDSCVISTAELASCAVRKLAHLTRRAIAGLRVEDLYALIGALAELTATMPQILTQLSDHLDPDTAAAHPATAVDTAHQTPGDSAETNRTSLEGVNLPHRHH